MLANERYAQIYDMLSKNGAVTTSNLVKNFGVSIETIRRDLLAMEKQGMLTRVHGGAVIKNDMKPRLKLNERNREYADRKTELAKKAMEFVCEGDIIGIDAGSTAISFAEVLREHFKNLTVITYSLDVFEILQNCKDFNVILCGGKYMVEERTFYGELSLNMLRSLHVHKGFIFTTALSLRHGIFDHIEEIHQMHKTLMDISDEIFVLADSSKFEKTGLLKLSDMKNEYIYITDEKLDSELIELYKTNDITIHF